MTNFLARGLTIASTCFVTFCLNPAIAADDGVINGNVITVGSDTFSGNIRLGGSVVPEQIVNLTAQMPGDVSFVAGSEGDVFRMGEALIKLDSSSLLAKRQQVLSQIASADAGYRNAVVQYNHELVNPNSQANSMMGGAPSLFDSFSDPFRSFTGQGNDSTVERRSNLYSYSVQVETARNAVTQAYAALQEIDESLQNAVSYAPFDGVILKRMVEKGDIVQPGMPLVNYADITRLQIHVSVPTRLLSALRSRVAIYAWLDGVMEPVPVKVNRIFPMADAGGHTTMVKFDLPQGIEAHSGMYAEIGIPDPQIQSSALPSIPKSAIVWRGSLPGVFKVVEDGSTKLRLIRIDDVTTGNNVTVISGINTGDQILANPSARENN
jgi:multidrug efflux pump subunit AcrA (membrane-fusion protein)